MLDAPTPLTAEEVEPKAVLRGLEFPEQARPQYRPLRAIDHAFEHRVLYALPIVEAGPGYPTQAAPALGGLGRDVIAHQHQHRRSRDNTDASTLLPQERRVGVEIAAKKAREQCGLEMRQQAERRLVAEERVHELVVLLLLIGLDHAAARGVIHRHPSRLASREDTGPDLREMDQREGEPITQGGTQLFHEVQRQARAARAVAVEEPDLRIETHGLERRADVMPKQGVDERQQRVEIVLRWPPAAAMEEEVVLLLRYQMVEDLEVDSRGTALDAAQRVERRAAPELGQTLSKLHRRRRHRGAAGRLRAVAQRPPQHRPAIGHLRHQEGPGQRRRAPPPPLPVPPLPPQNGPAERRRPGPRVAPPVLLAP